MAERTLHLFHVDDNENDRFLFNRAIATTGLPIHLVSAASGEEALRLLNSFEQPPDLVLLDIRMPEMSGLELLEALKSGRHADLQIAMYSTSDHDTDVVRAKDLGAVAYYVKRGGFEGLVDFLRRLYETWDSLGTVSEWPKSAA